jgi:threonine/homoserine efflux transporter RhtA
MSRLKERRPRRGTGVEWTIEVVVRPCGVKRSYSLMVALLLATATVIGVLVLRQVPTPVEITAVALVVTAVAVHRERADVAA